MSALGTRKLKITIDGDEHYASVSKAVITSAESDSDFVTFADADAGGSRAYTLDLTIVQDPSEDSLWDMIWSRAGETVPVVLYPAGGATPSATTPSFSFDAVITEPDGDFLGGEADASTTARFVTEVSWPIESKPVRDVTA